MKMALTHDDVEQIAAQVKGVVAAELNAFMKVYCLAHKERIVKLEGWVEERKKERSFTRTIIPAVIGGLIAVIPPMVALLIALARNGGG